MIYVLNFNRHTDSVSELTTKFFRTSEEAIAESDVLRQSDDMWNIEITGLDADTLETLTILSLNNNDDN